MSFYKEVLKSIYFSFKRLRCPIGLKDIGKGTVFRKPLRLKGKQYISIGSNCDIMNGIRMECISEWNHKCMPTSPKLVIEDNVIVGQNCHFTCANKLIIGRGTNVLPDVLITDIKHISEKNKSLLETDIQVGSVIIGKYVQIGMGARIMANGKDISIGDNAIIGANAVVTADVKADTTVAGIPARQI